MALLRTLRMLETGERLNDRLTGSAPRAMWADPWYAERQSARRAATRSAWVGIRKIIGALNNGHVRPMSVT